MIDKRVAAIALFGVLAGAAVLSIVMGGGRSRPQMPTRRPPLESAESTSKPWPMNARGQTYGITLNNHEPDLVRVMASNNRLGYSYPADLTGPTPRSPEEALRWQAEQAGKARAVPVYEADGETEVGVFLIGGDTPRQ